MRPELPQFPKNTEAKGEIDIYTPIAGLEIVERVDIGGEISPLKLLMKFSITQ